MTSADPNVQKSLASGQCEPKIYRYGYYCHLAPICVRCARCVGHCTCPPPELRFRKTAKKGKAK